MRIAPSLTRRIAIVFLVTHFAILLIGLVALRPLFVASDDGDVAGPSIVAHHVAGSVTAAPDGTIRIVPTAPLAALMRDAPYLWAIVDTGRTRVRFGPVPGGVKAIVDALPRDAFAAQFRVPGVQPPIADAVLTREDSAVGPLGIVAGGVDPATIGVFRWLQYIVSSYLVVAVLIMAALAVPAVLIAAPVALRRLRPLIAEAKAIDPAYPDRGLSVAVAPRELRPLVAAFNATLGELADELERRRRFIADVSHELRTPLAILALHVDALPDGPGKGELLRLQYRLTGMVAQMLDAGRLAVAPMEASAVDLRALASETVAEFAPLAIREGYSVALTGAAAPVIVAAQSHAIARALANLLGNAVAHGGGRGQIEVRIGDDATIDVIDEGPGVAPEARSRIFLPFSREQWDKDGCGLGLHLVREIMRAHRGEVDVIDAPHGHFRLSFPT